MEVPESEQYRQTQNLRFDGNPAMFDTPSKRILLFCTSDPAGGILRSDISFPHQMEIKVNGQDVKSNFRGVKGKAGSIRPADITSLLHRSQTNYITITYAHTQKRFYLTATLVKKRTVDELVEKVRRGRVISTASVLHESMH